MGYTKNLTIKKSPSFVPELLLVSSNMFFLKFYSAQAFDAMSFFAIFLPSVVYLIVCLFANLIKFIQFMQIDDGADDSSFMTTK